MQVELGQSPALVTRAALRPRDPDQFLQMSADGAARWTTDPTSATAFKSMREATRAALHLPGGLRAFSVPVAGDPARAVH